MTSALPILFKKFVYMKVMSIFSYIEAVLKCTNHLELVTVRCVVDVIKRLLKESDTRFN